MNKSLLRENSFIGRTKSEISGKARKIKFALLLHTGRPKYVYQFCEVFFSRNVYLFPRKSKTSVLTSEFDLASQKWLKFHHVHSTRISKLLSWAKF